MVSETQGRRDAAHGTACRARPELPDPSTVADLPAPGKQALNPQRISAEFDLPDAGINLVSHLDNLEKTYVVEALRKTAGNQTKAAELLQLSRWDLYEVMGRYKVPAIDLTPEELQQELTKVLKPHQPV